MENKRDISNNENKAKVENDKIEALIPESDEPKKKNTWLFVIIGVLILIVLIFVGLIATGTLVYNNTKKVIEEDVEEIIEEDELVLNDDVKLAVSNKLYKLLGGAVADEYKANNIYYGTGFDSDLLRGELTDLSKQIKALKFTKAEKDDSGRWQTHPKLANIIKMDPSMSALQYHGTITFDDYNKTYLDLFGTGAIVSNENVGVCPEYYYSEANNEFYKITFACGSISFGQYISYISNYEIVDDKVELNIHFGFVEPGYGTNTVIYGNFEEVTNGEETSLKPIDLVEEIDESLTDAYAINDTNKDKFSNYKFTFKNLNNNFIFEKVEKIK